MQVDVLDQTESISSVQVDLLKKLIMFVGSKEKAPSHAEVAIIFVSKEDIRKLNLTYRQIDKSTDVLSFPIQDVSSDREIRRKAGQPFILGDIIISVETAREQAVEYGHSFKRELGFLTLHGFLHLIGYDHITEKEEEEMITKQTLLLKEFGLER